MSDEQYRPRDVQQYPRNMVVAILAPAATTATIEALRAAGVAQDHIDVAQGDADAQRIVDETESGVLGRLTGFLAPGEEHDQRAEYVAAMRGGDAVIRVVSDDQAQKETIRQALVANGARFINFYGRWTVETLNS